MTNERYFQPGENFTLHQQWQREAKPQYQKAVVNVPGRLHFGVLDFSKMAPGLGGGGLGISTNTVGHKIAIKIDKTQPGCKRPTGQHLLQLFKQAMNYQGDDIAIELEDSIQHTHSGFGSNVSFNTAVIAGLNALFGSPLSAQEIWDMVTLNYVENTQDSETIYFGLDTGVGEACLLYGGLVWVDATYGQGRYIGNVSSDNLWVLTAVGDRTKLTGEVLREYGEGQALSEDTETALVASHFMRCEQQYGQDFRRFIKNEMSPALYSNDISKVLKLGWDMNNMSNMKVLEGIYKTDILQNLNNTMKQHGALYAGMSSAGPGFFAFANSEAQARELGNVLEAEFGEYFYNQAVGRAGDKLTVDLLP